MTTLSNSQPSISIKNNSKVKCKSCSLSHLCIPNGLSVSELKELDTLDANKSRLDKEETLYRAGESHHKIFAVSSGSLKTTIVNPVGNEQISAFYLPGELIGLDSLGGTPSNSTAIALETSMVCEISEQQFESMCSNNQAIKTNFLRLISKEISTEQHHLLSLGQLNSDEKLASFLISLSSRFADRGFSSTEFNLSMSRHDIANYLGITVETVSRLFKKFQTSGLIEVKHRNIKLVNRDQLCEMAHASCAKHN